MDFFKMIPQATKDMVHIFAARGMPRDQIGVMTHLSESTVARILDEPHEPVSAELLAGIKGPVNTTPSDK